MLARLFTSSKRSFSSLSEQEILAVAIAAEEDDSRIYQAYADQLRRDYPASAKVFEDMAEVEDTHRKVLIDMVDPCERNEVMVLSVGRTLLGQFDLVGSFQMVDLADRLSIRRDDVHVFLDLRSIDHGEYLLPLIA